MGKKTLSSNNYNWKLQCSIKEKIQEIIKNDFECQKVITNERKRVVALKEFCKENNIKIIANQYYSMSARTRRILKSNIIDVVREVVNHEVPYIWW